MSSRFSHRLDRPTKFAARWECCLTRSSSAQWAARVLPQGLIAGKPVVSYDTDGAKEVVIPNETGYLLPSQSIAELPNALCELATDPALRLRLGATGRARFREQFRHQFMTQRIREVYAEVLGSSGGRG